LELVTDLDRYLDILEITAQHYARKVVNLNSEAGVWTSHKGPANRGSAIKDTHTSSKKVVDEIEWFYQFIEVTPLWQDSKSLLYRMQLPL